MVEQLIKVHLVYLRAECEIILEVSINFSASMCLLRHTKQKVFWESF